MATSKPCAGLENMSITSFFQTESSEISQKEAQLPEKPVIPMIMRAASRVGHVASNSQGSTPNAVSTAAAKKKNMPASAKQGAEKDTMVQTDTTGGSASGNVD
jgi:hypothetical protein